MSSLAIWRSAITAGCIFALFFCKQATCQVRSLQSDAVYIKFDDPHCPYTLPSAINAFQIVTGSCSTRPGAPLNGFIRDALGNFTIFNPPGSTYTQPMSINALGAIAGNYADASGTHGFVRAPDGTFTTIHYPGSIATFVSAINGVGVVTGSFYFGDLNPVGYVFPPGGPFTPIGQLAPPNGGVPFDINEVGIATGVSFTPSGIPQGFVRAPDGTNTYFMPGFSTTMPFGINRSGVIAGFWLDPVSVHGFLRATDGTIASYPYPGNAPMRTPPFFSRSFSGVFGGINADSTVTGTYLDSKNADHGFVRLASGVITTFDLGPGNTFAVAINDSGIITGYHQPNAERSIGYLRVPQGLIAH